MASSSAKISAAYYLKVELLLVWSVLLAAAGATELTSTYYNSTCPDALSTIKAGVESAIAAAVDIGPALLRLHFHDCFVNGCDASVLLDDTSNFTGEKTATSNLNSLRGFDVIDTIKSDLEDLCPNTVSCADILAVVAKDAVVTLGGPSWTVLLGRRDSTTANKTAANFYLPLANMSLSALGTNFENVGLNSTDLVTLSGMPSLSSISCGHTIGQARCVNFRSRIYNDTNINSTYADSLKSNCPTSGDGNNTAPLKPGNYTNFDNGYYEYLLLEEGLLHSDQELFNGGGTDAQVAIYAKDSDEFFADFGNAMIKMGNISPLTGSSGEIRTNCRKVNSVSAM
ncbi:hypothetical protein Nepgr_031964 [Nepenthes gracilis]|uniref:Peroxidase n=1 Tax=Nepenthes gracilis TaxID=150966 RepID=A0AAD3Y7Y2_NEPGR|nr:hypothetical protein Nepgr_031964 [Nepenthes gracilis]